MASILRRQQGKHILRASLSLYPSPANAKAHPHQFPSCKQPIQSLSTATATTENNSKVKASEDNGSTSIFDKPAKSLIPVITKLMPRTVNEIEIFKISKVLYQLAYDQGLRDGFYTRGHLPRTWRTEHTMIALHIWMMHKRIQARRGSGKISHHSVIDQVGEGHEGRFARLLDKHLFDQLWDDTMARVRAVGIEEFEVSAKVKEVQEYTFLALCSFDQCLLAAKDHEDAQDTNPDSTSLGDTPPPKAPSKTPISDRVFHEKIPSRLVTEDAIERLSVAIWRYVYLEADVDHAYPSELAAYVLTELESVLRPELNRAEEKDGKSGEGGGEGKADEGGDGGVITHEDFVNGRFRFRAPPPFELAASVSGRGGKPKGGSGGSENGIGYGDILRVSGYDGRVDREEEALRKRSGGEGTTDWRVGIAVSGDLYYYNVSTLEAQWKEPQANLSTSSSSSSSSSGSPSGGADSSSGAAGGGMFAIPRSVTMKMALAHDASRDKKIYERFRVPK